MENRDASGYLQVPNKPNQKRNMNDSLNYEDEGDENRNLYQSRGISRNESIKYPQNIFND